MSNLVLSIEVKGNSSLSSSYIEELLKKNGVKILSLNNFSTSDVADNIMSVNNNIAWIGIEVRGSKVCVEVVEKPDTPSIYKPDEKYNIVAAEDGVVADIFIKKGVPVVNKGDTVKKNQLLVSGVVDSKIQQYRYVNPEADIRLISWRTKSSVTKLHQTVENLTDNIVKDVLLEFNNKAYGYKRRIPFKYYNDRKKVIEILPCFKILVIDHIENIPQQIEYSPEELFEIERRKLYNDIVSEFNQEYKVINSNAEYNIYNGELNTIVTCTIEGPFVEKIKNE